LQLGVAMADQPSDSDAVRGPHVIEGRWRGGRFARVVRVLSFAAALVCAALAYRDHLDLNAPWTAWAWQLGLGVALLIVALWEGGGPTRGALRWLPRLAGAALAVAGGWWGAWLAQQPGRELEAAVAIVAGLFGFVVFRWVPFAAADVRALLGAEYAAADGDRTLAGVAVWRPALLSAVALVLAASAVVYNPTRHLAAFVLWLASLAAFAAAFRRRQALDRAPRWQLEAGPPLSPRGERAALLLILLAALALRATILDAVPAWINPDEGRLGRYAERLWADGFPDAFGLGWNGFPHLSYMVHYAWVQILGTSNPHLRLSAATVGVLSLVPMFYWARFWWGNVVALLATALLAINQTHLMWSRIAFNNIHQVLVAALILLCFARVLRRRAAIDWVWLGFAAGLAFHTYHAAKLLPLLLVPIGLLFAIGIRGLARRCLPGVAIGSVAFVLCLGPLVRTTVERWDFFWLSTSNRVDVQQLIDAHRAGDAVSVRNYIDGHVGSSLFAFTRLPTPGDAYLSAFTAVPFALGIGWMLWRWRDPRHLTVLVWIAGILVIGGMITDYPPATTRMLGFLPAVCLIPAVVAGRLRGLLCGWRGGAAIFTALAAVWLAASAHATWHQFFVVAPPLQRGQPMAEICRVIRAAPLPSTLYMVGGDAEAELRVVQNDCMVAAEEQRRLVNLAMDASVVPLPPDHAGTGFVLVSRLQRELVPLIREAYPEARYEVVYDRAGADALHIFELSPRTIALHRGLRAEYRTASGYRLSERAEATLAPPLAAEFPVLVQWRGALFVPEPGVYEFRTSAGELRIDRRFVAVETPVRLAAGWHALDVAHELLSAQDPPVSLEWKRDGTWSAVPAAHLHDRPPAGGLLGRYFGRAIDTAQSTPIDEPADYESIDPALSFRYRAQSDDDPTPPFAARPSTMEWSGSVDFGDRPRRLRVEATTPTRIFLAGEPIVDLPSGGEAAVDLPPPGRRVAFLVRTVRPASDDWRYWALRVLWQEPGGEWSATVGYRAAASPTDGPRTPG
jgi:4-amino-4-deoxy-L-arabinose transferase-like glycosyltransferase